MNDPIATGTAATVADTWKIVDGPPSAHGQSAKVLREIANLSNKSQGIVDDLCDCMKDAMDASSEEEAEDIIKAGFDLTAVTQTDVLHSSRRFFVLIKVMRIIGFPVRGGVTIIPHVLRLLFDPDAAQLKDALETFNDYRTLMSPRNRTHPSNGTATRPHPAPINSPAIPHPTTTPLQIHVKDLTQPAVNGNPLPKPAPPRLSLRKQQSPSPPRNPPSATNPNTQHAPSPTHHFPSRTTPHHSPYDPNNPESRSPTSHYHAAKEKQNAAVSVKDMTKFTGSPQNGADLVTTKDLFMAALWQHKVDPLEATDILYHCLDKEALRFFFDKIRGQRIPISEAFSLLEERFDITLMHTQARAYLNSIDLQAIMQREKCDDAEALQQAHERICETLLNVEKHFREMTIESLLCSVSLRRKSGQQLYCQ